MLAKTTGDATRRHRVGLNVQDQNISLKIQNDTEAESMTLLEYGLALNEKEGH